MIVRQWTSSRFTELPAAGSEVSCQPPGRAPSVPGGVLGPVGVGPTRLILGPPALTSALAVPDLTHQAERLWMLGRFSEVAEGGEHQEGVSPSGGVSWRRG